MQSRQMQLENVLTMKIEVSPKWRPPSGVQEMVIINESGLYSLILSSKLDSAKRFKHWVTSEVLPSIRKHDAYMTNEAIERTLTDPDYLIQLATALKKEREEKELEKRKES